MSVIIFWAMGATVLGICGALAWAVSSDERCARAVRWIQMLRDRKR